MSETPPHLLLCYDDSPEAARAIAEAGRLLRGGRATVLYAWESAVEAAARFATAAFVPPGQFERDREQAREVAKRGATLALQAGFDADAQTAESRSPTWAVILHAAEQLDVDLIVLGARGLTGVRALLLGSVSHHVVNLTRRSTLVVPAAEVAAKREVAGIAEVPITLEAA